MRIDPVFASAALLLVMGCAPKAPPTPADLPRPTSEGIATARALPAPYNEGDPVAGRDAFAVCAECHSFTPGASEAKGPILGRVYGVRAGTVRPDYPYTEALRNSGFTWTPQRLDQWIFNPRETLPGTTMSYIGVRNDRKRRDIVAYLAAVSSEAGRD